MRAKSVWLSGFRHCRTSRHRPLPRPRGPADPALHPRQAEADQAAGGAEAGHHPPRRHPRPRPQRPPQALRRGVAGRRAGALGGRRAEAICSTFGMWITRRRRLVEEVLSLSVRPQHRGRPIRILVRSAPSPRRSQWTARRYAGTGRLIFYQDAPTGEACVVSDRARIVMGQRIGASWHSRRDMTSSHSRALVNTRLVHEFAFNSHSTGEEHAGTQHGSTSGG